MEFGIGVEPLDRIGETVELTFNATVESLSASNIVVRDAITNERRGIASVVLADDGRSAQVMFLGSSDQGGGAFLEPLRKYNFQMTIPGFPPATYTYERPAYLENVRVVDSSASNETITFNDGTTLNAYEGTDYEAVLGTGGTVAFNSDYDVVQFFVADEDVLYGAVTDVEFVGTGSDRRPVEIALNGEWYDLAEGYDLRYNGEVGTSLASEGGPTADYAKFVLNSQGEVAFYDAYDWDRSILVEEVNDGIVSGFGQELDLNDYTIVEDGQTISYDYLSRGDNLFFNDSAEYAEVYNEVVVGNIDRIFQDSVIVDGVEYDFDTETAYYINEDDEVRPLTATVLEDFENSDEPVSLYLNRAGEISFVLGDLGDLVRSEDGAYLTADANAFAQGARGILELNFRDVSGEGHSKDLVLSDFTEVNGVEVGDDRAGGEVDGFRYLTAPGADGEGQIVAVNSANQPLGDAVLNTGNLDRGDVVDFVYNSEGEIVGITELTALSYNGVDSDGDPTDATVGQNFLRVNDGDRNVRAFTGTPVFLHTNGSYEAVVNWGDIEDFDTVSAIEVYETDGVADYLVINLNDTDIESAISDYNVVVDRVTLNAAGDEVARLTAIVNGERQTFDVDLDDENEGNDDFLVALQNADDETVRGLLAEIGVNEDGVVTELDVIDDNFVVSGTVSGLSTTNRTLEINGTSYTIEANGYLVSNTGETLTINTTNLNWLSNLGEGNSVRAVLAEESSRFIDYIVIDDAGEVDDEEPEVPAENPYENGNEALAAAAAAFDNLDDEGFAEAFEFALEFTTAATFDESKVAGYLFAYEQLNAEDRPATVRELVAFTNDVNSKDIEVEVDEASQSSVEVTADFTNIAETANVALTVFDSEGEEVEATTADVATSTEDYEVIVNFTEDIAEGDYTVVVSAEGISDEETFEVVDPTVTTVDDAAELLAAIASDQFTTINLADDIITDQPVRITDETINGNGNTLTVNNTDSGSGNSQGLGISGDATVNDLVVTTTATGEGESFRDNLIETSSSANVVLNNVTINNGTQAGLTVLNNSTVTLTGTTTLNGNTWGGIEVHPTARLVATETTFAGTNVDADTPLVWIDGAENNVSDRVTGTDLQPQFINRTGSSAEDFVTRSYPTFGEANTEEGRTQIWFGGTADNPAE